MTSSIALVTGGSKGIGRAVVRQLLRTGHRVITCGRNATSWADSIASEPELAAADFIACDLTDSAQRSQLFETIAQRYGRLDLAVNNAAQTNTARGSFLEADPENALANLQNDLWMPMTCLRHEVKLMLNGGAIVNISSIAGLRGVRVAPVYSTAKHGLEGFTRVMALECIGQGIRINAVAPGGIYTKRWEDRIARKEASQDQIEKMPIPIGRFGRPEEIAEAVCWLLSPASSYVVGHTLVVDGGFLLQ